MLRDKKITQAEMDENNVKSVPGKKLTGDAQSNKNVFDKLVEFLAGKYNRMVDELVSPDGASQIGVRPVLEITGENAQAVFEFMASLIKTNNLNAVHKMGAEEISGIKTFLDQISVGNGVTKGVLKFEQDYVVLESSRSGRISRLELGQFQDTALNLYFTNWDGNRYKIWHGGNDGSGSGLDADTVDGKHVDNQSTTAGLWTAEKLISELEQKVDKVAGMGLSQSSFLHTEKAKLAGMEDGANRYILPPGSVHTLGGFKVGENLYADPDGTLHSMGGGGGSGGSLFFIQREVFVTGEGQVESIVIPYIENFKTNAPEVLLQNGNAWENAFEGMHYTFRFVSTVSLEITFYQVGTYKVNYGYASISHMLAEHVDYISEESGLSAANIQDAMDEVKGVLDHTKVALSEEVSARQLLAQNVQASMAPINSPVFTGTPKIGANVIATTNQIPTSFAASAVTVSEAVRSLYGLGAGASVDGALGVINTRINGANSVIVAEASYRIFHTFCSNVNTESLDVAFGKGTVDEYVKGLGFAMMMYATRSGPNYSVFPNLAACQNITEILTSQAALVEIIQNYELYNIIKLSSYATSRFSTTGVDIFVNGDEVTHITGGFGLLPPDSGLPYTVTKMNDSFYFNLRGANYGRYSGGVYTNRALYAQKIKVNISYTASGRSLISALRISGNQSASYEFPNNTGIRELAEIKGYNDVGENITLTMTPYSGSGSTFSGNIYGITLYIGK